MTTITTLASNSASSLASNAASDGRADSVVQSLIGTALSATGWVALIVIAAVAVAGYVWSCRAWPYTSCPHCDAIGRVMAPNGKNWRTCHRCNGTGQRLRLGAHLTGTGRGGGRGSYSVDRSRYRDGGRP